MLPAGKKFIRPVKLLCLPVAMIFVLVGAAGVSALEAVHNLEVQLAPERSLLTGSDRIEIKNHKAPLRLHLGAAVRIDHLAVNGKPTDYRRDGRWIIVDPSPSIGSEPLSLEIRYHGRFDDSAPVDPVNTDNPSFGVSGTISTRGTLLLAGAGWYPSLAAAEERFRLEVIGPVGMRAVTAGRMVAAPPRPGHSVSAWQIDKPLERLSLVAGNFKVRTREKGHLYAMTFFLNDDAALAEQYLTASLEYLADYEALFGPYPFAKFAVVENFFPTGYGFPSFTLIGGRVLRLPFIIHTSLKHEIAHCWWGNGVLVDYSGGNWSEGLTTYVSDYRFRESTGPQAARDYRRQLLRNFSELVPPAGDFPLTRFAGRYDPLTKAVGYDKSAMVFHMLRQRVGDKVFWATLKQIAVDRMFQPTAWKDIQAAFEAGCQCSLENFFAQWVRQPGAPQLALTQVERTTTATGTRVTGIVQQSAPVFELELPIRLSANGRGQTEKIVISRSQTRFDFQMPFVPERLEVDPHFDIFRRLEPEEMPPTINRLKSARDLLVILPEGRTAKSARRAADRLVRALGIDNVEMVAAAAWSPQRGRAHNIMVMQMEGLTGLADLGQRGITVTPHDFSFSATSFDRRRHTYVGVLPHPEREDGFVAVYLFGRDEDRLRIATKVPHYGRYSYLVFENARNVAKGTWPVDRSPLIYAWPDGPRRG